MTEIRLSDAHSFPALRPPGRDASVCGVHAAHPGRSDFPAEREHTAGVGAELHVVPLHPSLQLSVLMRPVKAARKNVAALRELDTLERTARLMSVLRKDGPGSG